MITRSAAACAAVFSVLAYTGSQTKAEWIPSDGYISTTGMEYSSSVEGTIKFKQFAPETFMKIAPFGVPSLSEYKNISNTINPVSIQLNFYTQAISKRMKAREYWAQVVLLINKKNGKMSYREQSELFAMNGKKRPIEIGQKIKGNGKIYTPVIHGVSTDTYIYITKRVHELPIPSTVTLDMGIKTVEGRIEITFMAGGKSPKAFDKIKIGSRGEFLASYFYASKASPGELGFGTLPQKLVTGAAPQILVNGAYIDITKSLRTDAKIDAALMMRRDGGKRVGYSYSAETRPTSAERLQEKMWIRKYEDGAIELKGNGRYGETKSEKGASRP